MAETHSTLFSTRIEAIIPKGQSMVTIPANVNIKQALEVCDGLP